MYKTYENWVHKTFFAKIEKNLAEKQAAHDLSIINSLLEYERKFNAITKHICKMAPSRSRDLLLKNFTSAKGIAEYERIVGIKF